VGVGGGNTPCSSHRGDLVFGGKPSCPLNLFNDEIYTCTTNWGVGYAKNEETRKSFLRVEVT
jgi:hypothetical protein